MNAVLVLVLFGIMHALRSFGGGAPAASIGTSVALGYLLLTGYFVGRMFASIRLPKLTGYIITGILVGPAALGLINQHMVDSLEVVNGMAAALVALSGGIDLDLRAMRPLFRSIRWITIVGIVGTAVLLAISVFAARPWLPFVAAMSTSEAIAVSALLGLVMVAQSPAVIIALNNELQGSGPVARTSLGLVVISDLTVILLFALMTPIAKAVLGNGGDTWAAVGSVAWELGGSIIAGGVLGYLLSIYFEKVRGGGALFLLALTFIIAEVGRRLQFDPLLVALAAGILIRNRTRSGDAVYEGIEASSLSIYVLFFSVAGMTLPLALLATVGIPALLFAVIRALGLLAGSWIGARIADADPQVRAYAGLGLLPQATLTIALAALLAETFPALRLEAQGLALSMVTINMLLAPIAYRFALLRSGEAGRRAETAQASLNAPPARAEA